MDEMNTEEGTALITPRSLRGPGAVPFYMTRWTPAPSTLDEEVMNTSLQLADPAAYDVGPISIGGRLVRAMSVNDAAAQP